MMHARQTHARSAAPTHMTAGMTQLGTGVVVPPGGTGVVGTPGGMGVVGTPGGRGKGEGSSLVLLDRCTRVVCVLTG